ncbi:YbjN domain-containing protein [Litorihabitans aurantiacus]|uniref:YbjN domain-containing protein n=1 Tax=Litorihabitans aurantiacus TaxID=1930061 RepID=UPI0024E04931|nr:YbjN domain-containing protein [Litorihabitans aurantiacus]
MVRRWKWWRRPTGDAARGARRTTPGPGTGSAAAPDGAGGAAEAAATDPTADHPRAPGSVDGPGASNVVATVTRDRVAASLRRRDYRYLVDERGDLCGLWAYRFFSFGVVPDQVLQVRGRWSRQASIERLWEVLAFTDSWNRERHHPKCYVRVHDDGRVHVLTEVTVPVRSGLSDAQIDHLLAVGLASGGMVFDALDELYPDPALNREPS